MKFGELETVRLIGKGGMSEVWEAKNTRLESKRAVKVYAYGKDNAEVRARFGQEGRMLAKLAHPRIVGVSDIGETEDGRPYFVMDLVLNPDGVPQSLADVPDGEADEDTIARWYDDIRDGLAYIHAKGIVHRDLKLENVMIGPDGHAVLTDFGISRITGTEGESRTVDNPVNTLTRICEGKQPLMGSLGYMAPELELGCAATPQSDWYALGVIVYKLLTGTWCDVRTNLAETLDTFNPAWLKILPKLLHSNPGGRECPSFAEVQRTLAEADMAATEERYLKEKLRGHVARHAARWIAGLAALLLVALFYGVIAFRAEYRYWQLQSRQSGNFAASPTFDELFAIPVEAKADDMINSKGDVTMPSRNAFAVARVDALVLTHPLLSALATGKTTPEKATAELETMAEELSEDSDHSPLDELEFGGERYMSMGNDNQPLRMLLMQAAEKLRVRSEE